MSKNIIKLRAHHGLCLCYFVGKGYSNGFVENMMNIKEQLEENPLVCISTHADAICEQCPNNIDGICTTEEKVMEYDLQVLSRCNIAEGDEVHYHHFNQLIQENILLRNQRKELCNDCQWSSLCNESAHGRQSITK